ncbi:MAG: hypothetical protein H6718_08375 [Polyangiaceae bacterium]|nr:hypothetical protein [Polyangiaceae bacterium]MCB9606585.1 hypothetical protein [Polyangiaceae bacterium]
MAPLPPIPKSVRNAATGVSWLALVAATSLGVAEVEQVKARVSSAEVADEVGAQRLIVQTYDVRDLRPGTATPVAGARPIASIQRSVTAEDLRRGVEVSLVSLGEVGEGQILVAWVERGEADLEYDGMLAKPSASARFSTVEGDPVRLDLA